MKREVHDLHFDASAMPMPRDCYDALMDAARSVKEEEPMKRASFRAVLIAAIILVATTAVAFAAQQLGWVDFYGTLHGITMPKAAEETMQATQPIICEVGPMTFTYQQLVTDKHIVLSSAEVRKTDGVEVLIANDADLYEAVDAVSDTVLKKYNLTPGTTWVEAAKQLHLPLYGVRALVEVAPDYASSGAMEDMLWSEDGFVQYFNMPFVNKAAVQDELPVTLYMAVHVYDAEADDLQINAFTQRREASLLPLPLLAEKTYHPTKAAVLQGIHLTSVHAEQYATGVYFTGSFTLPDGMTEEEARDILYAFSFCDAQGNRLPEGLNLTGGALHARTPAMELEVMSTIEALPEVLIISDGETAITAK